MGILSALPPFVDKEGEEVSLSERPGPLLLYFSAHWCPPCRGFTPKLVEFFSKLEKKYPDASIAFVSSDKDSKAWASYYQSMGENWLSLPYDARDDKEKQIEDFPRSWAPKPYADLCKTAECKGSSINDEKALCVFVHQLEDKNVDGLKALASKNEKADTLF